MPANLSRVLTHTRPTRKVHPIPLQFSKSPSRGFSSRTQTLELISKSNPGSLRGMLKVGQDVERKGQYRTHRMLRRERFHMIRQAVVQQHMKTHDSEMTELHSFLPFRPSFLPSFFLSSSFTVDCRQQQGSSTVTSCSMLQVVNASIARPVLPFDIYRIYVECLHSTICH